MSQTPKTLFIHVGPPKTGTSAIQNQLNGMSSPEVFYPKCGLWPDGSHHNLVFSFFNDSERPDMAPCDVASCFQEIGHKSRQALRSIVISSEVLVFRDVGAFGHALRQHLDSSVSDIRLVLVCREHFARSGSVYNQLVKDTYIAETASPDEFLLRDPASFTYAPFLKKLRATGFPVDVMNYHPAETLVERFLGHVGCRNMPENSNSFHNVSLSVKGLIATLAANIVAQTADERIRYFNALQRMDGFYSPSLFIFGASSLREVSPLFKEDRAFLQAEYGIDLPDIDPSAQTSAFFLAPGDLTDINAAVAEFGDAGKRINDVARRYVA